MDPIELRLRNEPEKDPTTGHAVLVAPHRRGLPRAAPSASAGTSAARSPGTRREGEWLIGMGCATGDLSLLPHAGRRGAHHADARRPRHASSIAAHEMGMGTATAQTQVAAERLGLPLEQVDVRYGDSTLPGTVLAGGSQQTAVDRRVGDRRAARRWSRSC